MRRKKHIKTSDKRLFRQVMKNVKPLKGENFREELEEFSEIVEMPISALKSSVKISLPEKKSNSATVRAQPQPLMIDPSPGRSGLTAGIDRRTAQRLRQGKLKIDAKLDLHGYHLHEAHNALVAFIQNAFARHNRCLLVITGKGRLSPHGRGKIKNALPIWLNEPNLRPYILSVSPASRNDGGSGAYYVYLRRNR